MISLPAETVIESEKGDCPSNGTSNWEDYLGSKEDPNSSIMIRFPDGNRVTKEMPCSSQFMVSFLAFSVPTGSPNAKWAF